MGRSRLIVVFVIAAALLGADPSHAGQAYNPFTGRTDLCSTIQNTGAVVSAAGCQTLILGSGLTLANNGDGTYTATSTGGGGGGGASTVAGGPETSVQFNKNGAFNGMGSLTWVDTTARLTATNLIATLDVTGPTVTVTGALVLNGASITNLAGNGLQIKGTTLGLTQTCADQQILKYTASTSTWGCAADAGGSHNLLSSTHPDTVAASVVRGDLIVGNSTPAWARLAVGGSNTVLTANATDAAWSATPTVTTLTATGTVTGAFVTATDTVSGITVRASSYLTLPGASKGITTDGNLMWKTESKQLIVGAGAGQQVKIAPAPLGWFGDGSDGIVTVSTNSGITRDMFYRDLTINSGVTFTTSGYIVYVKNTLTNNGTITCGTGLDGVYGKNPAGGAAGTNCAAGIATSQIIFNINGMAGVAGTAGVTASGGVAGTASSASTTYVNPNTGGTGGGGGAGGGGSNGANTTDAAVTGFPMRSIFLLRLSGRSSSFADRGGGIGGASGGGGGGTGTIAGAGGGGSGSGGGVIIIIANQIDNPGAINADGGNGGVGGSVSGVGNRGGGGGGGGGAGGELVLIYNALLRTGTITANGGAGGIGGSGSGTGASGLNGTAGGNGIVLKYNASTGDYE